MLLAYHDNQFNGLVHEEAAKQHMLQSYGGKSTVEQPIFASDKWSAAYLYATPQSHPRSRAGNEMPLGDVNTTPTTPSEDRLLLCTLNNNNYYLVRAGSQAAVETSTLQCFSEVVNAIVDAIYMYFPLLLPHRRGS